MDDFVLVYNYLRLFHLNKDKPSIRGYNIQVIGDAWIYKNPFNAPSETSEHKFGWFRMKNKEFITLDLVHFVESNERQSRKMFEFNPEPTRET